MHFVYIISQRQIKVEVSQIAASKQTKTLQWYLSLHLSVGLILINFIKNASLLLKINDIQWN